MNSRRMRWMEHVTRVGYVRRECKVARGHSGDLALNGSVLLSWILGICLIWLFWLRIKTSGWLCFTRHWIFIVPWNAGHFVSSWATISFSRRTMLCQVTKIITGLTSEAHCRCWQAWIQCYNTSSCQLDSPYGGQVALGQSLSEFCDFPCQLFH
jgi:hypothetical protein